MCTLQFYKTWKCFDAPSLSSCSPFVSGANFGNTRLYSGRQTVSCCLIGALKRHFMTPWSPTLWMMFPWRPCLVVRPAGMNHW